MACWIAVEYANSTSSHSGRAAIVFPRFFTGCTEGSESEDEAEPVLPEDEMSSTPNPVDSSIESAGSASCSASMQRKNTSSYEQLNLCGKIPFVLEVHELDVVLLDAVVLRNDLPYEHGQSISFEMIAVRAHRLWSTL